MLGDRCHERARQTPGPLPFWHDPGRRDGKYVLLTNDLSIDAGVAKGYKDLQVAERLFVEPKGVVGLRPSHHQLLECITAHVLLCAYSDEVDHPFRLKRIGG